MLTPSTSCVVGHAPDVETILLGAILRLNAELQSGLGTLEISALYLKGDLRTLAQR